MSITIKVYVLSKRQGTELGEPAVFPSQELAYKEMETEFYEALSEYVEDAYIKDETAIYDISAVIIVANGYNEEWRITVHDLIINDFHGFFSAFEKLLTSYNAEFKQFIDKVPQALEMAETLSENLNELVRLLSASIPEHVNKKRGEGNV